MHRVGRQIFLAALLTTAAAITLFSMTRLARSDTTRDVTEATLQALAYLSPTNADFFSVEGEIGRAVPRRIVYSPEAELLAVVDAYNALLLMDAMTYATRYTLEPFPTAEGGYTIVDMRFSHDGRYLALLTDKNVELWDTQTGTRAASLVNPGTPKRLLGPLTFSSRDEVLIFYGEYAAPPAVRQSENDSVYYPWVWHLGAARAEAPSTLPGAAEAQLLFDYGLGFALTPNDTILAVLPSRLAVLDALTLEMRYEIPAETYADDTLTVYPSIDGQRMYVRAGQLGTLLRVDTAAQTVVSFSGATLSPTDEQMAGGRPIPRGALFSRLLGTTRAQRTRELVLIDFIQPLDPAVGSTSALAYVSDIDGNRGFTLLGGEAVLQMVVSPDQRTLLTREGRGDEVIAVYDIDSGEERYTLVPSLRGRGSYSRAGQNRVLAFDLSGESFLSDFQRFEAETGELLAEDLRYSFSFDRFYFGRDPGTMVTISGSEWRVWDIASNTVLRREVLAGSANSIQGISPDAYRIAFWAFDGAVVQDFDTNATYTIPYPRFTTYGLSQGSSILNPAWTRMVTVYSDHPTGMYAPGGAIALTEPGDAEPVWLIAGDDLPPVIGQIGWVNDETLYVSGTAAQNAINERVFGVDYAPSGLPACIEERYPQQREAFLRLWERRQYFIQSDEINRLALDLCTASSLTGDQVAATLAVTPTPTATRNPLATLAPNTTPLAPGQPPPCLFDLYPNPAERDEYTNLWQELSAAVPPEAQNELVAIICERITSIRINVPAEGDSSASAVRQVMWIDAETGVRSMAGSLPQAPPPASFNPTELILSIYRIVSERQPTAALMNSDRSLLAVSNLPGELTIYRPNFDPARAGIPGTATAIAARTSQRLIFPAVTDGVSIIATATPDRIGTARPTLTITPSQTVLPLPSDTFTADARQMCTSTLYSVGNLPPDYAATGRIYATFGDTGIWGIEPEDGSRAPDENAPLCGFGLNCRFSPDRAWILAQTYELVYVVRPDNSDQRILWDLRTPNPPTPFPQDLRWAAPDMLEWNASISVGATPTIVPVTVRDVLNVFPDPALLPSALSLRVNNIPATVIAQQPGGLWVVLETTYGTGTGYGYRYYLHRLGTENMVLFAQHPEYTASFRWIGYGDALYFYFNSPNPYEPEYEVLIPTGETRSGRGVQVGALSPDGTRIAYIGGTVERSQMVIQEVETGTRVTYCLPRITTANAPLWSPDGRYLTWIGRLSGDEEEHLFVLDSQTGSVIDMVRGIFSLITWGQEPGSYGTGDVVTPAPEADGFPTPTPPGGGQ
jgi:WD40 repeat protein